MMYNSMEVLVAVLLTSILQCICVCTSYVSHYQNLKRFGGLLLPPPPPKKFKNKVVQFDALIVQYLDDVFLR